MASSLLAKEIVEARRQDEARFQRRKTAALKAAIVEEERARKREIAQRIKAEKQRQARRAQREADRMASGFDGGFASGDPEDLKDIFEEFDADGSGSIDIAELGEALTKLLGKKPQKKVVRDVMKSADADGNGELDFEEFITLAGSGELQEKIMMNPKFRVMHEVRERARAPTGRALKAGPSRTRRFARGSAARRSGSRRRWRRRVRPSTASRGSTRRTNGSSSARPRRSGNVSTRRSTAISPSSPRSRRPRRRPARARSRGAARAPGAVQAALEGVLESVRAPTGSDLEELDALRRDATRDAGRAHLASRGEAHDAAPRGHAVFEPGHAPSHAVPPTASTPNHRPLSGGRRLVSYRFFDLPPPFFPEAGGASFLAVAATAPSPSFFGSSLSFGSSAVAHSDE